MKQLTATEQLIAKRALETLDTVAAGLPPRSLFDQVERLIGTRIDDLTRQQLTDYMCEREWIYSYTDKLTGVHCLAVRQSGILAAAAL